MSDFTFKKEKHIEYIVDNFDFERVNRVMKFLNWEWYYDGVPSIEKLRETAIRMLNEIYESDYTWASTGGFKVSKYEDHLQLEFIIEDYASDIINNGAQYEKLKKLKTRKRKINTIQKLKEDENN